MAKHEKFEDLPVWQEPANGCQQHLISPGAAPGRALHAAPEKFVLSNVRSEFILGSPAREN